MTLDLVVADGMTLEEGSTQNGPAYEVDGTLLVIRPPRPVPVGGSMVFEFEWSFIVPEDGLGRMGWDDDNVLFVGYWFPKMAVLDDVVGWHLDPSRSHSRASTAGSRGDFRRTRYVTWPLVLPANHGGTRCGVPSVIGTPMGGPTIRV